MRIIKRLISSILIFVFIILFAVFNFLTICRNIDTVLSLLESDRKQVLISNTPDILRTRTIIEEWEKHEVYMASILPHHEIEDLEIGMMLLENYAAARQYEEYIETVNECIDKLRHVKETQRPDLSNIL